MPLDYSASQRIIRYFRERVATHPEPWHLALQISGEPDGRYRFRIGDYRAIAFIFKDEITVEVLQIGHRREVYR